jgi:hypothetical protein
MDKKYYLLLKQHSITGLKYLCFHYGTYKSCFIYKGSGSYWRSHLRKHQGDVVTVILESKETREELALEGIRYSNLWDIVKSKQFANLIIEDAKTTAEPLLRPEVRIKARANLKKRIVSYGLTEKEINTKKRAISIMHSPENRAKARKSINRRYETNDLTEKQLARGENRKARIKQSGFTEAEVAYHNTISARQKGKSMNERLQNESWVHPSKGKSATEIYGDNYVHPRQGVKMEDVHGLNYIDPKSIPFKLIINSSKALVFKSERDFITQTKLTSPMLCKLRKNKTHIIKRQSNSLHSFDNGDRIEYIPLTIDQYKNRV